MTFEALIWRRIFVFSPAGEAIAGMDDKQRGGGFLFAAIGDRAHHRQGNWRSDGARYGGRWPASSVELSILTAEGRPIFFLPAMLPDGRQSGFSLESWHGAMEISPTQVVTSPATARFILFGSCQGPNCIPLSSFGVLLA